jgi:hypothetical protein
MVSLFLSKQSTATAEEQDCFDPATLEMYQSFMAGYVRRINEATLRVAFGGIRIGSAKYSRLAQINLKTRIITFSRYAIENVPARGRRYLVIHELAHVKESSHNKPFWELVERFEPNYRQIGKSLELAFKRNVDRTKATDSKKDLLTAGQQGIERLNMRLGFLDSNSKLELVEHTHDIINLDRKVIEQATDSLPEEDSLDCLEDDLAL